MTTKMSRVGRGQQILQWIYRNDVPSNPPTTIGQYARKNGVTKSPYLKALFNDLVFDGLLISERTVHMGKIADVYHVNLAFISEAIPELYELITIEQGQMRLPL